MVKQNSKKTASLVKKKEKKQKKKKKKTIAQGLPELKDDHIIGDKNTHTRMVKGELAADYNIGEKKAIMSGKTDADVQVKES